MGEVFLDKLPDVYGKHDDYPSDLIGAKIIRFGTIPALDVEGGGLVIEYQPAGIEETRRLILAFSELGMWIAFSSSARDISGGSREQSLADYEAGNVLASEQVLAELRSRRPLSP